MLSGSSLSKAERQKLIIQIIQESKTYDQINLFYELNDKLKDKNGGIISLATVSRDCGHLGVVKDKDGALSLPSLIKMNKEKYELEKIIKDYLADIYDEKIGLFAFRSNSGASELIAQKLKNVYADEIISTISENNLTLVITRNSDSSKVVLNEIRKMHKEELDGTKE